MCEQKGQMRHRLSGSGWFRCERINDRRMGENDEPERPSVFFRSFLWIKDGQDDFIPAQIDSVKLHMRDDAPNLDLLVPSVRLSHSDKL